MYTVKCTCTYYLKSLKLLWAVKIPHTMCCFVHKALRSSISAIIIIYIYIIHLRSPEYLSVFRSLVELAGKCHSMKSVQRSTISAHS